MSRVPSLTKLARRVRRLSDMVDEYERRPNPNPVLVRVVSRGLRDATATLCDAVTMRALHAPAPRSRAQWQVSADVGA